MEMLDAHLVRYREERRKSDPGYMSPMQYRRELGPAAKEKPVQDFHRTPRHRRDSDVDLAVPLHRRRGTEKGRLR